MCKSYHVDFYNLNTCTKKISVNSTAQKSSYLASWKWISEILLKVLQLWWLAFCLWVYSQRIWSLKDSSVLECQLPLYHLLFSREYQSVRGAVSCLMSVWSQVTMFIHFPPMPNWWRKNWVFHISLVPDKRLIVHSLDVHWRWMAVFQHSRMQSTILWTAFVVQENCKRLTMIKSIDITRPSSWRLLVATLGSNFGFQCILGRHWSKIGGCTPSFLASHLPSSTVWPGPRPTFVPSAILINPAVWPQ